MSEKDLARLISGEGDIDEERIRRIVRQVALHIRAVYEPIGGVHAAEVSPQELKQEILQTLLDARFPNDTVEPLMGTHYFDALKHMVRDVPLGEVYEAAGRFVEVAKIASDNHNGYVRRVVSTGILH